MVVVNRVSRHELNVKAPTDRVATDRTAFALRSVADRLEADQWQDGHHELKNQIGEIIGTVYFDFSEEHNHP